MSKIWYNSDEVSVFQPAVERALNNALVNCGYDNIAEVVHNPTIPNSFTIPDTGIRLKSSKRYVFIVEVKRTQRDVESQRYQNQSRSYVTDFGTHWEPNFHKYFCVTNIERLILLADRQGVPLTGCVLKGNPKQHSLFNPLNHDATSSILELQLTFETILQLIFSRVIPDWDNNWNIIIQNFHTNYVAIKNNLDYPEATSKELTLYELFRLFAYAYLKDFYTLTTSPNTTHFRNYPPSNTTLSQFITNLSNNYDRIIQLDFKQIFSNHPNKTQRIFPDNFSVNYLQYFRDLIQCFAQYNSNAVAENSSPSYVFNLLTSKIYDRQELHRKGKIMSDSELSNLLAVLCIDSYNSKVLDPGCGDGALLDAAYDQISLLYSSENKETNHNKILNQIDGIEVDPFLSQLAAFRLLSKNLAQVNSTTVANILIGDIFKNPKPNQYDVILMNPPFLRNDNPETPITSSEKEKMVRAINNQNLDCFVIKASQPNLYFYFTNFVWHYLNANGKVGIILMAKFLNNEDGKYLKQFISDKVESVISYPRKYFSDFDVTTVVVVLKKGNISPNISFLRVLDEKFLLNPEKVKSILNFNEDSITSSYKLKVISRTNIEAESNWKQFLEDNNYDNFANLNFLVGIEQHFPKIPRGGAEANGGSKLIFPRFEEKTNQYFGLGQKLTAIQQKLKIERTKINIPISLNSEIRFGVQNNFERRSYILTIEDIELDKSFHFSAQVDKNIQNLLPSNKQTNSDLIKFFEDCIAEFGRAKWGKIVNSAFRNTIIPKILIPRADRTKHCVYYNPNNNPLTLSTNFFYLNNLQNQNSEIPDEMQYKFITAFLLSSFGQIQFELNSNNQEGLRKLEGFQIKRFKIPNLKLFTKDEILSVIIEFETLSILNCEFSGDEGLASPRRNLDLAFGKTIFSRDKLGFENVEAFVNYFELFLAELVEDRRI